MNFLEVSLGGVKYDLKLKNRISVIVGRSASGKTKLLKDIRRIYLNYGEDDGKKEIYISEDSYFRSSCFIYTPSSSSEIFEKLKKISTEDACNSIFIIDEDFKGLGKKLMNYILLNSNINLIIINRGYSPKGISFSVDSIGELVLRGMTLEYVTFNSHNRLKAFLKLDVDYPFEGVVLVEDNAEGKILFKACLNSKIMVESTRGKDKVIAKVDELVKSNLISNYKSLMVSVDMCAYGNEYFRDILKLSDLNIIPVYTYNKKSFEQFMLKVFKIYTEDMYKDYLNTSDESPKLNEEQFYGRELETYIDRFCNVKYIKNTDIALVLRREVFNLFKDEFKEIPFYWVSSYSALVSKLITFKGSNEMLKELFNIAIDINNRGYSQNLRSVCLEIVLMFYFKEERSFNSFKASLITNDELNRVNNMLFKIGYKLSYKEYNGVQVGYLNNLNTLNE